MLSAEYGVEIIHYLFIEPHKIFLLHIGQSRTSFAIYFTGDGLFET